MWESRSNGDIKGLMEVITHKGYESCMETYYLIDKFINNREILEHILEEGRGGGILKMKGLRENGQVGRGPKRTVPKQTKKESIKMLYGNSLVIKVISEYNFKNYLVRISGINR